MAEKKQFVRLISVSVIRKEYEDILLHESYIDAEPLRLSLDDVIALTISKDDESKVRRVASEIITKRLDGSLACDKNSNLVADDRVSDAINNAIKERQLSQIETGYISTSINDDVLDHLSRLDVNDGLCWLYDVSFNLKGNDNKFTNIYDEYEIAVYVTRIA